MKKSSLVLYFILFLILGFFAFKVNSQNADFKSEFSNDYLKSINENLKSFSKISSKKFKNAMNFNLKEVQNNDEVVNNNEREKKIISENLTHTKYDKSIAFSYYPKKNSDEKKVMYKIKVGNKFGLLNSDKKIVTKTIYEDFLDFDSENGIYKSKLNGKYGLINYNGRILVPSKFESIVLLPNSNFAIVKNHSYCGLYDLKIPKMVVNPIYKSIEPFDSYNWKLTYNKKVGLAHYRKKLVTLIKPKYSDIVSERYYLKTVLDGKCGAIDILSGEIITEPKYDSIELVNQDDAILNGVYIYKTQIDDRYGLIFYSLDSLLIIPPIYADVKYKGLVSVLSSGNWQLLDNKGRIVTNKKKYVDGQ
ncbi:MAG: WG repeat-containing protein [Candidatus Gastranaerophilaceae bacterium]